MNHTEALKILRLVETCCPAQKLDNETPDAWGLLLDDIAFDDAKVAVLALAREQRFIAPSEIRDKVKAVRAERIRSGPAFEPPAWLDPDDVFTYRRLMREHNERLASGAQVASITEARETRPMPEILGTFRRVPGRS